MKSKDGEAIVIGGLGYGDEGKGSMVDYFTRVKRAGLVVRYNGGAQAGHNVKTPDGRHHTFSQFGSGTFLPEVKTHLSRFMILNPVSIYREEEHLQSLGVKDAFLRLTIDENALVTTPFQIAANRLLEIWRNKNRRGSCGMGIGRTIEDCQKYGKKVLFAGDLRNASIVEQKLKFIRERVLESLQEIIADIPRTEAAKKELKILYNKDLVGVIMEYFCGLAELVKIVGQKYFEKLIDKNLVVIFEGAQGVLLDNYFGFYPYVAKTNATLANADTLLREAGYLGKITRVGVLRGYSTRHGAGPFVTEDYQLSKCLWDPYNQENQWQGKLRFGWLDLLAFRYAIKANEGIDYIALTNLDHLSGLKTIKICLAYEYRGELNFLDPYFEFEPIGENRAKITAIKKTLPGKDEIAKILFQCEPSDFAEFPGWKEELRTAADFNDMPPELKDLLTFLESDDGLRSSIKIVSTSPTREGKIPIH